MDEMDVVVVVVVCQAFDLSPFGLIEISQQLLV